MTSLPGNVSVTHPLSELMAHGDAKQPKTRYRLPVPGSGKVSYHCRHDHCRHCAILDCTCACHMVDNLRRTK